MLKWVFTAAMIVALPAVASAQQKGDEAIYQGDDAVTFKKKCFLCHEIGEGAKTKQGPTLNGVAGRKPGTLEGYEYSQGMKDYGADKVWDEAALDAYLSTFANKTVKGTKMNFVGIKDEAERKALVAFLGTIGPDGKKK